jgi:hypothetical protein
MQPIALRIAADGDDTQKLFISAPPPTATLKKESRIFADMHEIGDKDDGKPAENNKCDSIIRPVSCRSR